jgi:hypothetical protein
MQMLESSRTRTERGHTLRSKKAWDFGRGWLLIVTGEEALITRVTYHLDAQYPEAHPTLEQAEEFVGTQVYEVL